MNCRIWKLSNCFFSQSLSMSHFYWEILNIVALRWQPLNLETVVMSFTHLLPILWHFKEKMFKNGIAPHCLCLRAWDVHCSRLIILQFIIKLLNGPNNIKPETSIKKKSLFFYFTFILTSQINIWNEALHRDLFMKLNNKDSKTFLYNSL